MVSWILLMAALGWHDGRPALCDGGDYPSGTSTSVQGRGSHGGNLWERAKAPAVAPYCARLASVIANLSNPSAESATNSLSLLREAETILPGQGMTNALRAWALFEQGSALASPVPAGTKTATEDLFREGFGAVKDAERLDHQAGDEPRIALVFARLASAQQDGDALTRYERALGRSSTLPPRLRAATYFEAGIVALSRGPSALTRATAILREGLRVGGGYEVATQLALAFALGVSDRGAEGLMLERTRGTLEADALHSLAVLGRVGDADALRAMSIESRDPAGSKALWARYAERRGPWEAFARAREAKATGKRKALP